MLLIFMGVLFNEFIKYIAKPLRTWHEAITVVLKTEGVEPRPVTGLSMKASLSIDRPVNLSLNHQYKNLTIKGYSGPSSEGGDVTHKQQQQRQMLT
jgi:hypothetical protein